MMKRMLLVSAIAGTLAVGAGAAANPLWTHVYRTTIKGAAPAALNGSWVMTLTPTTFTVAKTGQRLAVGGTLSYSGNRVTFRDAAGPVACRGTQAVGTYSWSLVGNRLTLRPVKDSCSGRKAILTNGFTRVY